MLCRFKEWKQRKHEALAAAIKRSEDEKKMAAQLKRTIATAKVRRRARPSRQTALLFLVVHSAMLCRYLMSRCCTYPPLFFPLFLSLSLSQVGKLMRRRASAARSAIEGRATAAAGTAPKVLSPIESRPRQEGKTHGPATVLWGSEQEPTMAVEDISEEKAKPPAADEVAL